MSRIKISFVNPQLLVGIVRHKILSGGRIEKQRRRLELIKDKNQDAEQQDAELHRDFADGVEHEAEPAFAQRRAGNVALHLRLVGAEIRKHQKCPAEQPRPKGVTLVNVGGKVNCIELLKSAGQRKGVCERKPGGQFRHQQAKRGDHAREDDAKLVFLRDGHGIAAAGHGVNDDQQPAANNRQVQRPAEDGGEHDGGRVNRQARAEAALHQKQRRAQQARLAVKTPSQKFVGGIDIEPAKNGQKENRNDDQSKRHAEIDLHEAQLRRDSPGRALRET